MDSVEAQETLEMLEVIEEKKSNASLYGFPMRENDERRDPNNKKYDIKQLWSRHKEIVQLNSLGYKNTEIASMLGITKKSVSMTLNSTLGKGAQAALRDIRDMEYDKIREEVTELTWKSLKVYNDILDNENASLKLQKEVADTITLELAGMRAPTRIQSTNVNTSLTPEEIAEFKERGLRAARAAGKLIDITPEPSAAERSSR